jgi:hypothetical protein
VNTPARLGAFGAALAATFGIAWGVGAAIEPISTPEPAEHAVGDDGHSGGVDDHGDGAGAVNAGASVSGLSVAADGYRLVTDTTGLAVDEPATFSFRIVDDAGQSVTAFDETHERELHLIVVRQDLSRFQHVHPTMAADGTWSIDLAVAEPGAYRLYAEFRPAGEAASTVLSTTAFARGEWTPEPAGDEARTSAVDGYELTLHGELVAGTTSDVTIEVRRDGRSVTDLEPYLGADGHLVALRAGDLAYAHVHPVGDVQGGPLVPFGIEVATAGTYRLFLDFRHGGVVRTATFTVVVPAGTTATEDAG